MSIFQRLSDLLKANVNDMIDKAEDPEKMVKQIILDMDKQMVESTQALGKAMASERQIKKQYDDAAAKSKSWEDKAKMAITAGDQELAKKALAEKVKVDANVAQFQKMYETVSSQTAVIREQVETLKVKLEEAKSRQLMLIARSKMADTQKDLAKSLGGIDSSNAFNKLDKMEDKIEAKEAEAQAFTEIAGPASDKDDPFKKLEQTSAVDSELARLMAEMGK